MPLVPAIGSRSALGVLATLAVAIAIGLNALADYFGIGPAWLISAPAAVGASFGLLYQLMDRHALAMGLGPRDFTYCHSCR